MREDLPNGVTSTGKRRQTHDIRACTLASDDIPLAFTQALEVLEGESGILGISPLHFAASLGCYPLEMLGVREFKALRLKKGKCAGASTPIMQVARTVRNDLSRTPTRKFAEVADSIVLAFKFPNGSPARDRFVADHLQYGQAAGQPLYGIRAAALAAFGVEPSALEEYQLTFLAALPKIPLALHCDRFQLDSAFKRQKDRAKYALRKSLNGSPRLKPQLDKLAVMEPIRPLARRASFGLEQLNSVDRCFAAAHPLYKAEALDSSTRMVAMAELAAFQMVGQRGAIAAMAKSPLVFHGNGTLGTLVGITANVPWVSGEVGKSGTYDDEGMTKGKFAVGAHPNGSWFAMVVPARGNLGDGSIGIAPLSKLARESSLAATPVTDIANFSDMRSDF